LTAGTVDDGVPPGVGVDGLELDRVRCRLAFAAGEDAAPADVLRLCRAVAGRGAANAALLYDALWAQGDVVAVDTAFGVRLALDASLVTRARQALARAAPPPLPAVGRGAPAPAPVLVHDLLTLAGFLRREAPRLTGRGFMAAPALRRLDGLALTPEEAVPAPDRKAPTGSRVWQFLFQFLIARRAVRLADGRAHIVDGLLEALAATPRAWSLGLFLYAAARLPVAATGWLEALAGPLPAWYELRRLHAWLRVWVRDEPSALLDRTLALLEATGLARRPDAAHVVLLPALAAAWTGANVSDRTTAARSVGRLILPDGSVAVDLAPDADGALELRVPLERVGAPASVGHVFAYAPEAAGGTSGASAVAAAGLAAVVRGRDREALALVAEALAPRLLGRWDDGFAVDALTLGEAIDRLERLGLRVERTAPGTWNDAQDRARPAAVGADAPGALVPAVFPWTLERARQGTWSADWPAWPRPRPAAAIDPAAGGARAPPAAPRPPAARLGRLVDVVVEDASGRPAHGTLLPLRVMWEGAGERVEGVWAQGHGQGQGDGDHERVTIEVARVREVRLRLGRGQPEKPLEDDDCP
jgi:hypothetical protein